jgi:hypothetical protein
MKKHSIRHYLPNEKIDKLISIYQFINSAQLKDRNLPDFPTDDLNDILAGVKSLWKKGWISADAMNEIMDFVSDKITVHTVF